ncbi:5'/3'-nucleotidase SurE family protein [Sclerotinia borealis F-4128]|uniref:5'/3'-nucleotidase SurE family protein n=1 Tax=Sclerotinia borealis (strain F-4128) TaxID=1432307 RepID=W9CBI3_SCLBF|nr:5'/3'-nucleotidase SurE family protein [Sclerotinia borealis F-4128]
MRFATSSLVLLPALAHGINIVSSNDDGWAEIGIRTLYDSLTSAGHDVLISAPAENKSGSGSRTGTPTTLTKACEFNSCPSGSPAVGYNSSVHQFNYVNSHPATAMEYGINTLAPGYFGGAPDLAVTGPNVGVNTGVISFISGTVGAAIEAIGLGIPAIAFSGAEGSETAWNAAVPAYSTIYGDLSAVVVNTLVASGTPYLPDDIWLNVNYPKTTDCTSVSDYSFVLSRIYTAVPLVSGADVVTCGNGGRLPTETSVVGTDGCYASISVGGTNKRDASAANQATVLSKLSSILTCLP